MDSSSSSHLAPAWHGPPVMEPSMMMLFHNGYPDILNCPGNLGNSDIPAQTSHVAAQRLGSAKRMAVIPCSRILLYILTAGTRQTNLHATCTMTICPCFSLLCAEKLVLVADFKPQFLLQCLLGSLILKMSGTTCCQKWRDLAWRKVCRHRSGKCEERVCPGTVASAPIHYKGMRFILDSMSDIVYDVRNLEGVENVEEYRVRS